ncbi:MAG TPA: transporter substrate-binding domain-containing protein [Candidatus Ozemobacteraceae bacterium]
MTLSLLAPNGKRLPNILPGILLTLLTMVPLFAGRTPARAQEVSTGTGLVPQTILSASEIDYPPFCMTDQQGNATGFSVELLQAAAKAMGRTVSFRIGPWNEVRSLLEAGKVSALPLVGRTPEREALFDFTVPYLTMHGAIVVRSDTKGISSIDDLRGKVVAVMQGDNAEEFLRRTDRGIVIHTTRTFTDALAELNAGKHDAVVMQRLVALRLLQINTFPNLRIVDRPIEGFRQDFCFAVREGDKNSLALLNEGLALVVADGTYRQLHAKWFAALELPPNRHIIVGGKIDDPPWSFFDPSGQPTGLTVELTRAIAAKMNLSVQIRLDTLPNLMTALENGEIDILQGITYSLPRTRSLDFTQPFVTFQTVAITRGGDTPPPETLHELGQHRFAVLRHSIMHEFATDSGLNPIPFDGTPEQLLRGIVEGKYDCALISRLSAQHLIRKNGWTSLAMSRQAFLTNEFCYGTLKNRQALSTQFSEGLRTLDATGELRRIREKWLGIEESPPMTPAELVRRLTPWLLPLILILIGMIGWSSSLQRDVATRTAALRASEEALKYRLETERLVSRISRMAVDAGDPIEFLTAAARVIGEALNVSRVTVFEQEETVIAGGKSVIWRCHAEWHLPNLISAQDMLEKLRSESFPGLFEALFERGVFECSDISSIQDEPTRNLLLAHGIRSFMLVAFNTKKEHPGFIGFYDVASPRVWPAADVEMLEAISLIAAGVLDRHRSMLEHQKLQALIAQGKKMESIGQLAGGVAHDFNNVLGVILGHAEIALEKLGATSPVHEDLFEIRRAAEHSADLTRQLLAFARHQMIMPRVLDLNKTITGMLKMLRRLIGENVELVWNPSQDLWPVKVDPSQIDQVLANLCVNGRDAIQTTGKIVISTRNAIVDARLCVTQPWATPGDHVMLEVSDNGIGMTKEILAHLFEPFFTTKEVGRGTGLGLATIWGIVQQNHALITVESELRRGTTFRLYIPRHHGESATRESPPQASPGAGETILLVEDEAALLKMTTQMLERLGYRVVQASTPDEAVRWMTGNRDRIDLVITDVIMPGMDGASLMRRLTPLRPGIRCIYISGYPSEAISHHGVLEEGVQFLAKPFTPQQLGAKIREVLGMKLPAA